MVEAGILYTHGGRGGGSLGWLVTIYKAVAGTIPESTSSGGENLCGYGLCEWIGSGLHITTYNHRLDCRSGVCHIGFGLDSRHLECLQVHPERRSPGAQVHDGIQLQRLLRSCDFAVVVTAFVWCNQARFHFGLPHCGMAVLGAQSDDCSCAQLQRSEKGFRSDWGCDWKELTKAGIRAERFLMLYELWPSPDFHKGRESKAACGIHSGDFGSLIAWFSG